MTMEDHLKVELSIGAASVIAELMQYKSIDRVSKVIEAQTNDIEKQSQIITEIHKFVHKWK